MHENSATPEDVIWAYKFFLRRQPEAEEVITRHLSNKPSFTTLVERFICSREYQRKEHYKVLDDSRMHIIEAFGEPLFLESASREDEFSRSLGGVVEPVFQMLARRHIPEDGICLDIGANIGIMSLYMSRVAINGKVFAFEPNPELYEILSRNLKRNLCENVIAVHAGASDRGDSVGFLKKEGGSHIVVDGQGDHIRENVVEVPVVSLDAWFTEVGIERLDFIKMDIEGYEPVAFDGMKQLIAKFRPYFYFEYSPNLIEKCFSGDHRHFLEQVYEYYEYIYLVDYDDKQLLLSTVNKNDLESFILTVKASASFPNLMASPVELLNDREICKS